MIKTTLTTRKRSTVLHNFFLLDMSMFNELVIKSDPVKKSTPFFHFMEWVQLLQDQVLVLEDKVFHRKVINTLYRNSDFYLLVNINFFYQPHKNFSVSRSLEKEVQRFGQFSHKHFRL